ncbi:MAG: helix-turn-helix domain-containing protein [Verrucomicrobia bacterium]|nr:helix-turn-helix domain-containing protein [Verrucomicrobiota bacterium]
MGERLEEARKRKGISLREAAEATKIRSDFLGCIEANKTDFDLPEIYKRGFLKNYARYLKLDIDKIMTDYNAQLLSHSRLGKKGGAEWFGQMEVKKADGDPELEQDDADEPAPYGRIAAKAPRQTENAYDEPLEKDEDEGDKTFYLKIGLIFVGTLALVFVVFGLISAILGGGGSDADEQLAQQPELRSPEIPGGGQTGGPVATNEGQITLTTSGLVNVIVRQRSDNEVIYKKTMAEGESVTMDKEGPVEIFFTAGENLIIEQNGERFRPNISGVGRTTLQ